MVAQEFRYLGELRTEAVHTPSGVRLVTDAPVDNHGRGQSFSPTDLVVTALATCKLTTAGIAVQRDGVRLDGSKVYAQKHMSTDAPRRIARIVVRVDFPPGIPAGSRPLIEAAMRGCPVARSLAPDVVVDLTLKYPD